MVSPILYEQFYDGAFIVSEAPGHQSIDLGCMDNATGSDILYEGGLVVVQAAAGAIASSHPANVGNGTIGSLSTLANSQYGTYVLTATSATQFNVVDPGGDQIGVATVGTAFAGPQVGFTITAGGTAFAAGDIFNLAVTEQTGGWQSWTGGSITTAIGILYNRVWVPAGTSAKVGIVRRNCEVVLAELQWDPAVTGSGSVATLEATAVTALAATGIIAR
jgi:hypothetical protein